MRLRQDIIDDIEANVVHAVRAVLTPARFKQDCEAVVLKDENGKVYGRKLSREGAKQVLDRIGKRLFDLSVDVAAEAIEQAAPASTPLVDPLADALKKKVDDANREQPE